MARYFTPTPSQYISQFVPPNLDLMYKVGQERAAQDSLVTDAINKAKSEWQVEGGMFTDKEKAAQINNNINSNLDTITEAFYSGNIDSFQAARAINRLQNEVKNNKEYKLYKLDEAFTKSAAPAIAQGKFNNALGVVRNGINVIDARGGLKVNYKIDPNNETEESLAEAYNWAGAGEFEKEHQHFVQQASVPKIISVMENAGYGVDNTNPNMPVFYNYKTGEKIKGITKDAVKKYAEQYANMEWNNSTDKPSVEYMRRAGETKDNYVDRLTNLIMPGTTDRDITNQMQGSPMSDPSKTNFTLDDLYEPSTVPANTENVSAKTYLNSDNVPEIAKKFLKVDDGKIIAKSAYEISKDNITKEMINKSKKEGTYYGIDDNTEYFRSSEYKQKQKELKDISDNLGFNATIDGKFSYNLALQLYAEYLNGKTSRENGYMFNNSGNDKLGESMDDAEKNNILRSLEKTSIEKYGNNEYIKDKENKYKSEIDLTDPDRYTIDFDEKGRVIMQDKDTRSIYRVTPRNSEEYVAPKMKRFSTAIDKFESGKNKPIQIDVETKSILNNTIPNAKVVDIIEDSQGNEDYLIYSADQKAYTVISTDNSGNVRSLTLEEYYSKQFGNMMAKKHVKLIEKEARRNVR
jgi:hypothetical protein